MRRCPLPDTRTGKYNPLEARKPTPHTTSTYIHFYRTKAWPCRSCSIRGKKCRSQTPSRGAEGRRITSSKARRAFVASAQPEQASRQSKAHIVLPSGLRTIITESQARQAARTRRSRTSPPIPKHGSAPTKHTQSPIHLKSMRDGTCRESESCDARSVSS